jgi:CubicO group peptidase (beta-lactamase class C family)
MSRKKVVRVIAGLVVVVVLVAVYAGSKAFPIATGYGSKILCSGIFVSGRAEKDIIREDLNFWPVNLATFEVNYKDSSVSTALFGFAKKKAIFRHGFGATLLNDISEVELRSKRLHIPVTRAYQADSLPWPMGDKISGGFSTGIDSIQVKEAVERIFSQQDSSQVNITRALLVLYDGKLVAEKYGQGITCNTRLTGWSMTKSVMNAIAGILVKQNKLNINSPAPVPEWKDPKDPRHKITVKNLLQQTSGLDFDEVYDKPADANRMLFQEKDAAAFAASKSLNTTPGQDFRYSSGNTNILSRIFRHSLGDREYYLFPYQQFFHKIGMYNTVLEPDASGTFVGSSFCYATARDWARFGLLYAQNGEWNGEQILTPDWIKQSTTPSTAAERGEYGFQWWLNAGKPESLSNRYFNNLPVDMFWADGFEGQNVFIIPSKKLVVVRLGLTKGPRWGEEQLLPALVAAIKN